MNPTLASLPAVATLGCAVARMLGDERLEVAWGTSWKQRSTLACKWPWGRQQGASNLKAVEDRTDGAGAFLAQLVGENPDIGHQGSVLAGDD